MQTINYAWLKLLSNLLTRGMEYPSRNGFMLELPQQTISIDMSMSVLDVPSRKLNHNFMLAEAAWMIQGRDDVDYLTRFNKRMANFSDDGIILRGAYGPRIDQQISYVLDQLLASEETRQATLTTWVPNPTPSKDIPCTVAMTFMIRNGQLNMHVYMRSSDAWLGIPYDVFSFSIVAAYLTNLYNEALSDTHAHLGRRPVRIGNLYLTAASSHLYQEHVQRAHEVLNHEIVRSRAPHLMAKLETSRGETTEYAKHYIASCFESASPMDVLVPRTNIGRIALSLVGSKKLIDTLEQQMEIKTRNYAELKDIKGLDLDSLFFIPIDRQYHFHKE